MEKEGEVAEVTILLYWSKVGIFLFNGFVSACSVVANVTETWGSSCSDAGQEALSYVTVLETRFR